MTEYVETLSWKWYTYGLHPRFPDAWFVRNNLTRRSVTTSSESACIKIIELAYALKTGQPKPLNQSALEYKAKVLESIPLHAHRYWAWSGKKLLYDTSDYDTIKKKTKV